MNAVFGWMLAVAGLVVLVPDLMMHEYDGLWLPVVLMAIGPFMALRHRRDDGPDAHGRPGPPGRCRTCRGAGTVYSADWNDWRRPGPVHPVRDLCPACRGRT